MKRQDCTTLSAELLFTLCLLILAIPSLSGTTLPLVNWTLCPSSAIPISQDEQGAVLSSTKWTDIVEQSECFNVTVPCTVLAGLVQAGVYKDIFYGKRWWDIPEKQFDEPWWYRTSFILPSGAKDQVTTIVFHGINYRANIWVNGVQIGFDSSTVGPFRYFDFSLEPSLVSFDEPNELAVEVYRPHDRVFPPYNNSTDLAITFVDWAPPPRDGNMGLWRDAYVEVTGPVALRYPMVSSIVSSDLNTAYLTVLIELDNVANNPPRAVSGTVNATITFTPPVRSNARVSSGSITIAMHVTLPSNAQGYQVVFDNNTFPALVVQQPVLWWPWQMGDPTLHTIEFSFIEDGSQGIPSDTLQARFGIRQATSELDHNGHRLYRVNGQPILIRGGGWAPDLLLRASHERLRAEFMYIRDMGLNAIRLEGKMEDDSFFELADELGILTMPGWCCCDAWQHWYAWDAESYAIAALSLQSQVQRLRIHPSVLVFLYSSDDLPPADVEEMYLAVFEAERWPNPILSTASNHTSSITGPSGVKMSGPYSWVPPNYWLQGADLMELGGAFGFLTEGGPGENPLTYESLARTIPHKGLWPMGDLWDAHCGNPQGFFYDLRFFTPPLYARYGNASSAEDYLEKAQVAAYEAHRALFEGYSRNKYIMATGVIQWMLNNAWPEMIWHLYDYYLTPSSSYFATKKACEPLHVMYSYNDASVWIVNSLYESFQPKYGDALDVVSLVLDLDGTVLYNSTQSLSTVDADSSVRVLQLPTADDIADILTEGDSPTYFVLLQVFDSTQLITDNFYWLSVQPDVLEWNQSSWFRTPCSSYANLTGLNMLPPANVSFDVVWGQGSANVTVQNHGSGIAFFIRLLVVDKDQAGGDHVVLPIVWSDNYFSLLAGQTREVTATFPQHYNKLRSPAVVLEVYNRMQQ